MNRRYRSLLGLSPLVMVFNAFALTRYVAPAGRGNASGGDALNAADYLKMSFWGNVHNQLYTDDVNVVFLNGDYKRGLLTLSNIGHARHRLTLEGESKAGAVFRFDDPTPAGFALLTCQNILLRRFTFTGTSGAGYVTRFQRGSRTITLEDCDFIDIPNVAFGAAGAHHPGTAHIIFKNLRFERIGHTGYAHMIYNAYAVDDIQVIDSTFIDCSGHYVRFRAGTDHGIVRGCTFRHTGTYVTDGPPYFITLPVYNDGTGDGEYFKSHFKIFNNRFLYQNKVANATMGFIHKGFDPPGRHHLMTAAEGVVLQTGSPQARRDLLLKNCDIDTTQFRLFNNIYENQADLLSFSSVAQPFTTSQGWEGQVSLTDLLTQRPAPEDLQVLREDSFNGEPTGAAPSQWITTEGPETDVAVDSTVFHGTAGKSLHLRDRSASAYAQIQFKTQPLNAFYFRTSVRFAETNKTHYVFLGNGITSLYLVTALNDGSWSFFDGTSYRRFPNASKNYAANVWYDVELLADLSLGRFSVWLDGLPLGESLPLPPGNTTLSGFRVLPASTVGEGEMWVDDVLFAAIDDSLPPPPLPGPPPPAPNAGRFTTGSLTTLSVAADPVPTATAYLFSLASDPNPTAAPIASSVTAAPAAVFFSLSPNKRYYGFVRTCNTQDCSAFTAMGSTVTPAAPPASLAAVALGPTAVSLSFNPNGNPPGTSYVVQGSSGASTAFRTLLTTAGSLVTVPGLSPGTFYSFRVFATNAAGTMTVPSPAVSLSLPSIPDVPGGCEDLQSRYGLTGPVPCTLNFSGYRGTDPNLLDLDASGVNPVKYNGKVYVVANAAEVTALRAGGLAPGDQLVLKNGVWRDQYVFFPQLRGTPEHPILVRPETPGGVVLTGTSKAYFDGTNVIVWDLIFKDGAPNVALKLGSNGAPCNGCIVSRVTIDNENNPDPATWPTVNTNYLTLNGADLTVAHCAFKNKKHIGKILAAEEFPAGGPQRLHLLDNLFSGRPAVNGANGYEVLQIGWTNNASQSAYSIIENNRIENADGENETVKLAVSDVIFRRNTVFASQGALSLRATNRVLVEGNTFDGGGKNGPGGVRVIGAGHWVVGNTFLNLKKPLSAAYWPVSVRYGNTEDLQDGVVGYARSKNIVIARNLFRNSTNGIAIGTEKGAEDTLAPHNIHVRNNTFLFTPQLAATANVFTPLTYPSSGATEVVTDQNPVIRPTPGQGVVLSASSSTLALRWSPVVGADSYRVWASTNAGVPLTGIPLRTITPDAVLTELNSHATYYLFAQACEAAVCGDYGLLGSTKTWVTAYSVPSVGDAVVVAGTIIDPEAGKILTIRVAHSTASPAEARVYDLTGNLLRVLERAPSGGSAVPFTWDGRREDGRIATDGVYLLVVQSPQGRVLKKIAVKRRGRG